MRESASVRVFISYAHKDASQLVDRLRGDISREGYQVWLDTARLSAGAIWSLELERALDTSDVVVALLTRGSYTSDICRAEQLRALRKGKCVIPVLAQTEADRPLFLESRQYRNLSAAKYEDELPGLLEDIRQRAGADLPPRYRETYITVPPLPANYVERPAELDALRTAVLGDNIARRVALIALKGMGGIGKTILAQALCHDEVAQAAFPDGVIWLSIGQNPRDLLILFREAAKAAGAALENYDSIPSATNELRNHLRSKSVLLVLDDVWDARAAAPFLADSPRSRMLITTRDARVALALGAREQALDVLTPEQALQLLASWSDCPIDALPSEAGAVVQECGRLPLALAMVGALLRGKPHRWPNVLNRLKTADLAKIQQGFPEYPHADLLRAIQVSLDAVAGTVQERYLDFAIFRENQIIPEVVLKTLWNLELFDVQDITDELVDRSLASRGEGRTLRIHDLLLDYLRHRLGVEGVRSVHKRLVGAYAAQCKNGWADGPNDGYFFENLPYHLQSAGRTEEAEQLLIDFRWIDAKLRACGVISLLADYESSASSANALRVLHDAIRLCAYVLASDPNQLSGQLLGRLKAETEPAFARLRGDAAQWSPKPWLRPLNALLTAPGGPLLVTLAGHSGHVRTLALTPDGQVISGSDDHTIKLWDVRRGTLERTFTGHSDWVRTVVSIDGGRFVSASDDHTLRIWNLKTGRQEASITTFLILALAPLVDNRVVSVSEDRALRVWNLSTGEVETVLRGHTGVVNCVAAAPGGTWLVSGSDDRTLRIWSLGPDNPTQILKGHTARITAVSISRDGRRIVSASADNTLRLWCMDGSHASFIRVITESAFGVRSLVLSPDGDRVITGSDDYTLRVWQIEGAEDGVLEGHSGAVNAVVLGPYSRSVISASSDWTLKVWDLSRAMRVGVLREHADAVRSVSVTHAGRRAVSYSEDRTLRVWDLGTGALIRTVPEYHQWAFAVTPDGRRIISAVGSGKCRVWELETDRQLLEFQRHTDRVRAIALTPDGRRVISAGDDRTIRVWDIDTGEQQQVIQIRERHWPLAAAITPDGRWAITAADTQEMRLWDLAKGARVNSFNGHTGRVNAIAITANGAQAVSASDDCSLRVWDIPSSRPSRVLRGHAARVNSVCLPSWGNVAISVSDDCEMRLWDLTSGDTLARFTTECPLLSCAAGTETPSIVAGDRLGSIYIFRLEG